MEAIATGNEIANKLDRFSVVAKTNLWLGGIEVMNGDITDFEESLASGSEPSGNEVLHHLLLGIDRNTMPGQSLEIDGARPSHVAGAEGNQEFFLHARRPRVA